MKSAIGVVIAIDKANGTKYTCINDSLVGPTYAMQTTDCFNSAQHKFPVLKLQDPCAGAESNAEKVRIIYGLLSTLCTEMLLRQPGVNSEYLRESFCSAVAAILNNEGIRANVCQSDIRYGMPYIVKAEFDVRVMVLCAPGTTLIPSIMEFWKGDFGATGIRMDPMLDGYEPFSLWLFSDMMEKAGYNPEQLRSKLPARDNIPISSTHTDSYQAAIASLKRNSPWY